MKVKRVKSRRIKKFRKYNRVYEVYNTLAYDLLYEKYKSIIEDDSISIEEKESRTIDLLVGKSVYLFSLLYLTINNRIKLKVDRRVDGRYFTFIGSISGNKVMINPLLGDDGVMNLDIKDIYNNDCSFIIKW